MDTSFNIVEMIEKNPITRLSGSYQSKLITKIKQTFTDDEQQLFVASFYSFLNYDFKTDFVIDLDMVWTWLGFQQKYHAKHLLEKQFTVNNDYKIFAPEASVAKKGSRGGHNREIIMLTVSTFKKFCLKAGTKKADEIHDYYIKLEETFQQLLQEESDELKLQLKCIEEDKDKIREKTLLEQFPNNTQCVYYGLIDNVSSSNERLVKFGNSNFLKNRVTKHKETYSNFKLVNAFKVENKLQIENALKENEFFNKRLRTISIKSKRYVEILSIEDATFADLDKAIKETISSIEYSPENYKKMLEANAALKKQLEEISETNNTNSLVLLDAENKRLKTEIVILVRKYKSLVKRKNLNDEENEEDKEDNKITVTQEEIYNYPTILKEMNKKCSKNKDGTLKMFEKLYGTREEVWNEIAFKTSGGLIKSDLITNKNGKIVSRKKSIQETIAERFVKCGINKPVTTPQPPSKQTSTEEQLV